MQTLEMPATRAEALRRLTEFLPRAGRAYADDRNFDRGAGDRSNVSTLAPYIRCRLISEEEVVHRVLERFTLTSASKFVQEVFWRTYWKGWLESRPAVWDDYRSDVTARRAEVAASSESSAELEAATSGRTGIDAFDAWSVELTQTGYLHNHARMWFASIWIFTLLLPWELGADFFMRHLLCGDPASNTLSWRWVAGLHTRGKTYLARPDNIRRYTQGRLDAARLRSSAPALTGAAYPRTQARAVPLAPRVDGRALLLLHDDDAGIDTLPLAEYDIVSAVALLAAGDRAAGGIAARAASFARDALADALGRTPGGDRNAIFVASDEATATALAERARLAQAKTVITPFAPVGPVRAALEALRAPLAERGVSLVEIGRRYDALAWPHATRGYADLRERIPQILAEL